VAEAPIGPVASHAPGEPNVTSEPSARIGPSEASWRSSTGNDRANARHSPNQALVAQRRQHLARRGNRDVPFHGDLPRRRYPITRPQQTSQNPPPNLSRNADRRRL
jgi:hypothetical protein